MALKLEAKTVVAIVGDAYKDLTKVKESTDSLVSSIKSSATAKNGKSYWRGNRAKSWYCGAIRNCANSYVRVYKISNFYKALCKQSKALIMKDGKMTSKEQGNYDKIVLYASKFSALMSSCEAKYNAVLKWGKS